MIAKQSLLLCLFLIGAIAAQAEPLAPPAVKTLLDRIRAKRAGAGRVWFAVPNKFRREVKGNSPSVTVSDGQQLWIYYPKFQSAEHYSLGKHSPLDAGIAALTAALNLENVENSYHITASEEGSGYRIELAPRNPSLKRLLKTFTIEMNAGLQVQRTEMIQPNGDHIVTLYSNESRSSIDPATFEFTPPAGTNVTTPLGR
jgi:chaperone LolA